MSRHAQDDKRVLLAGKHVHFNKTMSTTGEDVDELIDLAERANLLGCVEIEGAICHLLDALASGVLREPKGH